MIGFLTHPHHRHTQSFEWLFAWLPETPEIHYGDDPGLEVFLQKAEAGRFEAVFLFQLDAALPYLSSLTKTICCPMYDASRKRPADYFLAREGIFYINMCRHMHQTISARGGRSMYYQYAPDPQNLPNTDWNRPLQAHFWEREPGDLDQHAAEALARQIGCEAFDLRLFQDKALSQGDLTAREKAKQQWDLSGNHLSRVAASQIFIAPRRFEGIGMAFLEAMGMGCVVVAENQPTANEYILHGETGLLYSGDELRITGFGKIPKKELARIGRQARDYIGKLHKKSRDTARELSRAVRDFLAQPPSPPAAPSPAWRAFCFGQKSQNCVLPPALAGVPPSIYRNRKEQILAFQRKNILFRIREGLIRPKKVLAQLLKQTSKLFLGLSEKIG